MFMLTKFVKQKLMQILQNRICGILRKCLRFIVAKFTVIILLLAEMKLILVAVKLKCHFGKLLVRQLILLLLLAKSLFQIYLVMKKKVIIISVLVVFMTEYRPTPFKIHLESVGEHDGWLDDFIDLIRRLYHGDSPYTYDKITIVIEIDGINDTGHFTSTVHYAGVANLKDYKNE